MWLNKFCKHQVNYVTYAFPKDILSPMKLIVRNYNELNNREKRWQYRQEKKDRRRGVNMLISCSDSCNNNFVNFWTTKND